MSEARGAATPARSCSRPRTKVVSCPGTAGCLWALTGSGVSPGERGTALTPTTTLCPAPQGARAAQDQALALGTSAGSGCPGLGRLPSAPVPSSPVLVVDVVSKARGVDDRQLHANPLLFNLCNREESGCVRKASA